MVQFGGDGMETRNIFLVTSCKGGVGKSTVAVNLALTLALGGVRVMLADCDLKNRTADLFLGYEDSGIFDLYDVAEGRAEPAEAILCDPRCGNLFYCSVPAACHDMDPVAAAKAAVTCADAVNADYLIIDTSGGIHFPLAVYLETVYEAIIVSTPSAPAIRAAAKTASELSDSGVKNLHLIVNCYRGAKGDRTIEEIIDETRISLLGVVPYDEATKRGQEMGKPAATVPDSLTPEAFYNITMRMRGYDIPLLNEINVKKLAKHR